MAISYTRFEISDVAATVTGSVVESDLTVDVTGRVTNTGDVAGAEVVQVYVGDLNSTVARPVRELKGFTKVFLAPGETRQVTLTLDQRAFAFWSVVTDGWVVEAGRFEIAVGSSSRDLAEKVIIHIDAPSVAAPLGAGSTLEEWLSDERAQTVLAALGEEALLRDPELVKVIGSMPMSTLAAFPGFGFNHNTLDSLIEQLHGRSRSGA